MMPGSTIELGAPVTILVDGRAIEARLGQTLASALLVHGVRVLRHTRKRGDPRGLFCGMGVCYDCVVSVNGRAGIRACMTPVEAGMRVTLPTRFDAPESP